jgi:hypothetical protein
MDEQVERLARWERLDADLRWVLSRVQLADVDSRWADEYLERREYELAWRTIRHSLPQLPPDVEARTEDLRARMEITEDPN